MNAWTLLLRALGALGVVTGVFVMHGLTADHEVAMASMHGPAVAQSAAMPAEHSSDSTDTFMHQVVLPIALVDAFDRVVIAPAGEQHGMPSACLAVLTGLLLLLTLVLGLRSLLAWRAVLLVAPERVVLSERSPPWLPPSLSKLCVLRT
ncbi:hypothetical protein EV646_108319 [Kribbella antiqua]|uniref:Uncharacterized protein n=1 Tax=Kribbella antiqua TaxID=2512217 RepID=A0A4R2IMW8_9ACTN|nr:DUF6153 family protein [Kribbella antiqua]TCO45696.1 hypothetical protein EV646_108319 [Kribbella antiqua]